MFITVVKYLGNWAILKQPLRAFRRLCCSTKITCRPSSSVEWCFITMAAYMKPLRTSRWASVREKHWNCNFILLFYKVSWNEWSQWGRARIALQFSSVTQSCPTLCDPMNRSTPGFPVHHHLPEFTQTHVHQFSDAIQPSHPLLSPFPPAPNPSQHQSLFQ